ncbi:MAG: hypothetical protein J7L59_02470 [Nanoarchaeota archaeon]|nr:hypothetical protein [Nanoarchaeota archaeon]
MRYSLWKLLALFLLFIFTYSLGLIPLVFYIKFILSFLDLNDLIHLLSLPFLMVLGFVIFALGEILSTSGMIWLLRLKYGEGVYELSLDDPRMFKWLAYQTIYYPFGYFLYSLTVDPLKEIHLKLCGAKIGKNVTLGGFIADPCLFEVGDNTIIGGFCEILSHSAEGGKLIVKKVKIGRNCLVGEYSLVMPGVRMEDGSILGAHSLATKDQVLKRRKVYGGTPARLVK